MRHHPAFAGIEIPRETMLGPYALEVLAPDVVTEDHAAVMESAARLVGFMGATGPMA